MTQGRSQNEQALVFCVQFCISPPHDRIWGHAPELQLSTRHFQQGTRWLTPLLRLHGRSVPPRSPTANPPPAEKSRTNTFVATLPPASRQMRAATLAQEKDNLQTLLLEDTPPLRRNTLYMYFLYTHV